MNNHSEITRKQLDACPTLSEAERASCLALSSRLDDYERRRPEMSRAAKLLAISDIQSSATLLRNLKKSQPAMVKLMEDFIAYLDHRIDNVRKDYE